MLGIFVFTVLQISSALAVPRVAVVGHDMADLGPVLTPSGMTVQMMDDIPGDAASLSGSADVVIVSSQSAAHFTPEQAQALESFVRAGGGLWVDAAKGPAVGALEAMTAASALDSRSEDWVALSAAPGSPLDGLDFSSLPRLNHGRSVAPPGSGQLELLNAAFPWYFSKPLWQDQWATWVAGPAPHRLSFLAVARYGAGRTAIWSAGDGLTDPALTGWAGYPEFCQRTLAWLGANGPVTNPASMRQVSVDGLMGPSWWSSPLDAGLKGMSQKQTLADFRLPPIALQEAGYWPVASGTPAPNAVLFGAQADASSQAAIVLRAPELKKPQVPSTFEGKSLQSSTDISTVNFVDDSGKETSVTLPHSLPAPDMTGYPTVGTPATPPAVTLPTEWKIAFNQDPDSAPDYPYIKPDFDDSKWQTAQPGKQTTTLFGKTMGYDGAIWYRGHVNVPADSISADAGIDFEGAGQHLEVYVDGKRVAIEPKKVLVPLAAIGAGDHVIAVRTFGELRTNYGLATVTAVRMPLLWRPDPNQQGWAQHWADPANDAKDWLGVSNSFGAEPAGSQALEGWIRVPVDVPDNVKPSAVVFQVSFNAASRMFINGVPQESRGVERVSSYTVPVARFHPGHNVVVFWTRFFDSQFKGVTADVVGTEPRIYRATVHADHAGESLQAVVHYEKPLALPALLAIRVKGQVVGGWIGNAGDDSVLLAPHALEAGDNAVEIAITPGGDGAFGLKSLEVGDLPANTRIPVGGWERLSRADAPADWYTPATADKGWEATSLRFLQDWEKTWVVDSVPDLDDPNYVYRTHLVLSDDDLKQNLTLFLKGASVRQLFVNGQPVAPDDESFYPLNHALHAGDNVLAFAPSKAVDRGMDILVPKGASGGIYRPELRTDVAPIEPVQPELAGYRLNRTFPVSDWNPPAGSKALFCWPDGQPAIVLHANGDQKEVLAAPGIFDDTLPGPNAAPVRMMQSGAESTISYEYASKLQRDKLQREAYEQLIPTLLAYAEGRSAWMTGVAATEDAASVTVHGAPGAKAQLAWRLLDWEGMYLSTGTADLVFGSDGSAQAQIPLPDLTDGTHDAGTGMGRFLRLRTALLSPDRHEVWSYMEHLVTPRAAVTGYARMDSKLESLDANNAAFERRIFFMALDELAERSVYLPGETPHITAYLDNSTATPQTVSVALTAMGGLSGETAQQKTDVTLAPYEEKTVVLAVDAKATAQEQPWKVLLEVSQNGNVISRDRRSFVVATPRGDITDVLTATQQGRSAGGYMWQMTPHALAIEHRRGTDALPIPGPWWTSVRAGGDGNWLVAEGQDVGSQAGLLWGPFYDQGRGEEINSYGWFPNGQSFRQWWAPYAVRELARTAGDKSVVFALSDFWQYDGGYPDNNYATFEMFNNWLVAHKGQTIAGQAIDGQPIVASTLAEMRQKIATNYKSVYDYFVAEGLSHDAAFTGKQLEAVSPGTVQEGQGAYAGRLPGVIGGASLAAGWAHYESLAILDADNHSFAGMFQYALESATFRALGVDNRLMTGWESPMAYHAVRDTPAAMLPMDASFWQDRLLDSRWQVIGDDAGTFQRVLNLTHTEHMADRGYALVNTGNNAIGAGMLPAHWGINDKLSPLAMTIGVAKPLSPLLVVGEGDEDWGGYYGMLGKLRDAGLKLGGAVSIAELDKLKPEDVPGLVWMPSTQVAGPLLAAVQQKVEAGVPLLVIGKLPVSENADWSKWLGVQPQDPSLDGSTTQEVDGAWQKLDAALGVSQSFKGRVAQSSYAVQAGGMEPIVQRASHLALGIVNQPQKKVVFYGLLYPLYVPEDAGVRRLAVKAFEGLQKQAVVFDDQSGGYAFQGLDGALYAVVENRQSHAAQAHLTVNSPVSAAADVLTGEKLPVTSLGGSVVTVPLAGDGATVVVLRP